MNENEADRIRDAIARDQRWTLCRCGHILDCCADCMGWLLENSPRIEASWKTMMTFWGRYSSLPPSSFTRRANEREDANVRAYEVLYR